MAWTALSLPCMLPTIELLVGVTLSTEVHSRAKQQFTWLFAFPPRQAYVLGFFGSPW